MNWKFDKCRLCSEHKDNVRLCRHTDDSTYTYHMKLDCRFKQREIMMYLTLIGFVKTVTLI